MRGCEDPRGSLYLRALSGVPQTEMPAPMTMPMAPTTRGGMRTSCRKTREKNKFHTSRRVKRVALSVSGVSVDAHANRPLAAKYMAKPMPHTAGRGKLQTRKYTEYVG